MARDLDEGADTSSRLTGRWQHGACTTARPAPVVYMVNQGHVRLCGTFKGSRFDLGTSSVD